MVSELYPFKSNFLDLGGFKMHYLDEGEGEPIVMLHGNPSWSFYYRNLVKALRGSYRVIVPDHMGCGLSDKPDDSDGKYSYTLVRRVKDIETLLNHLKIRKDVTLVVHDWGGMIGFAFATKNPGVIKRFVVMNTSAFRMPKTKNLPWQIFLCRNTPLGSLLVQGLNLFAKYVATYCVNYPLKAEIMEWYLKPYDSWKNRLAILRFVEDIPLTPKDMSFKTLAEVEDSLKKFADLPMLICWGEKDFVFDNHFLVRWMEYFPKADVHTFRDAHHYVLEDAGGEIISLVKKFLQENPLTR